MRSPIGLDSLLCAYLDAKERVIAEGYADELDWQEDRVFGRITERDFLSEAAWVILASGLSDSAVQARYAGVSAAFLDWRSAKSISRHRRECIKRGVAAFGHGKKIAAIAHIACSVAAEGFDTVRLRLAAEGVDYLREFPYMGAATSYHLAKNLGLEVVKPDRHLVRIAHATMHRSVDDMCRRIATAVGERMPVVDLVFWRYATLNRNYLQRFASL